MRYDRTLNHSAGWTAEDFTETPVQKRAEDDPWETPSAAAETASDSSANSPAAKEEAALPIPDKPSKTDSVDGIDVDEQDAGYWDDGQFDVLELHDRESSAEWAALLDLDGDTAQLNGPSSVNPDAFNVIEVDGSFLDEPPPVAEYDGELRQLLYEPDSYIQDLHVEVQIDQWVASIEVISDAEAREIAELLRDFSKHRLRRWLPWLRGQQWSGRSLLRFLQFRAYWDDNCELWECLRWAPGLKFWLGVHDRNSMSLGNSYLLVQRRLHCSADEVIDPEWFEDWDRIDVWVRVTQGFFSFSSFVMYRSQFIYAEDWRRRPDLDVDLTQPVRNAVLKMDKWDIQAYRDWSRLWFDEQDWYDPAEWHDGLGW